MEGITYLDGFIKDASQLFEHLKSNVSWDERMSARKTASFGQAYNYSQISYPFKKFLPQLEIVVMGINETLSFMPNNCLINYYLDGKSKMGFHSDQTDILAEETGVAIVSIGEPRILRFRKIEDKEHTVDFTLQSGSLFYMTSEIQDRWQHSIPKSDTKNARMSLTFRKLK